MDITKAKDGELIAHSGRWASDELPEDVPRYLLPKGFEKSKVLHNLHRVLEKGSDTVVIVEGFWSVLRLSLIHISEPTRPY